jgi:hypothetical protein
MDLIALRIFAALLLALLVHGALLSIARLGGERRALVYPALVIALGSVLSLQAVVSVSWLVPTVGLLLAAAAVVALKRTGFPRPSPPGGLEWVALALLALTTLWAAFPDYRYDQWNYHLVVAKAVAQGPLAPPVLNDHVFFTGVYEYLFTLARWWTHDDIFNQSFADAFTWLFWVCAAWGLLGRLRRDLFPSAPSPLLLLAFVSFAIPDQEALFDAKPDAALLVAALALIAAWSSGQGFPLGFFLVAPLALKVTWLHFALAVTPVLLVAWWRRRPAARWLAAVGAGLAVGAATVVPIAVKNVLFLGNPLHPAQLGPFRSSFWSEGMAAYWQRVSGAASTASEFGATLAHLPVSLAWNASYFFLPLLLLVLPGLLWRERRGDGPPIVPGRRHAVAFSAAGLTVFVLLWPFFFRASIYARFVFAGFAFVVVLSLWVLDQQIPRIASLVDTPYAPRAVALGSALLLLPAVFNGDVPDHVSRMGRWMLLTEERFLAEGPPEWQMVRDLRVVNAHRRRVFAGAPFGRRVTLVDMSGTYLLDGASLGVGGREYEWHRAQGGGGECLWGFLGRMDVTYVFTRQPGFDHWLPEYRSILPRLERLDAAGRVLYADPELVQLEATAPGCTGG